MHKQTFIGGLLFILFTGMAMPLFAQDEQPIYGRQLMTEQERMEYRERMRNATTAEEREQIRAEHHARMQIRAREQGIELPDEPPMRGKGMGPSGRGMGPGGGAGRCGGMGRGDR